MTAQQYSRRQLLTGMAVASVGGGFAGHFAHRSYNAAIGLVAGDHITELERSVARYARKFSPTGVYPLSISTKVIRIDVERDETQYPFLYYLRVNDISPLGEGSPFESIDRKFTNFSKGKVPFFRDPSNSYATISRSKPVTSFGLGNGGWVASLYFEALKDILKYAGRFESSDGVPQMQMKIVEHAKQFGGMVKGRFTFARDPRYKNGIKYKEEIKLLEGTRPKTIEVEVGEENGKRPVLERIVVFSHDPKNTTYRFDHRESPLVPFSQNPKASVVVAEEFPIKQASGEKLDDIKELYVATLKDILNLA